MKNTSRIATRLSVAALLALSLTTACDKSEGDEAGRKAAAADKSGGSNAAAGKVTVERLDAFDNAKVNNEAADFSKCVAAAEAQLGKASKVEGDEYTWAAASGEDCHMYILVGASGMMSRSQGPYKVGGDELEACKKIAG